MLQTLLSFFVKVQELEIYNKINRIVLFGPNIGIGINVYMMYVFLFRLSSIFDIHATEST